MKNLLFIVAVLFFASCKKSPALPSTVSLVQNNWQIQTINSVKHKQGSEDVLSTYNGISGDMIDFRSDGKAYVTLQNGNEKDTFNYSLINDNQMSINGSILANISTLNQNSFIFTEKESVNTTDFNQFTYTLKR